MTEVFSTGVSSEEQHGVLVVTIDNAPVNALSAAVRAGLMRAVDYAAATSSIKAVVITGAGKTFVGGADIAEFNMPPTPPSLPDVFAAIEALDVPVIAAINGAALGGGLELALSCHHRIAYAGASLGLPEVKLGIVPGAGGTQRLPRLVGVRKAVEMIGSGRIIKSTEALSSGLVDAVAQGDVIAEAVEAARALMDEPLRRTGAMEVPAIDQEGVEAAAESILARSKGQNAPAEAVRLVQLAASSSIAEGLRNERATFLKLRDSDQATALRHVFFAERAAAKVPGLESIKARPVETIGIVGAGLMGSGIAVAALNGGYRVIAIETSSDAAHKGRARIAGLLERAVKSGRLDPAGLQQRVGNLVVSEDLHELGQADLIIEAVFDDLEIKRALFARLGEIARADTILATNTSYLNPDQLAQASTRPERVLGMHFFSPAHVMRLCEVVRCTKTANDVLATGIAVAKRLAKLPVVCGVTEGFIGNRIFSAYRREAEFVVEEGALPHEVDRAMENFGMAMGPFAVSDLAGLEIGWARRKRQAATRDPGERYSAIADRLCETGRFGQKSGKGWYSYSDGRRMVDSDVTALILAERRAKNTGSRSFDDEGIVARLIGAMTAEGGRLLDEQIAARASDIDLVMINGYGFPAYRGGPMYMAAGA